MNECSKVALLLSETYVVDEANKAGVGEVVLSPAYNLQHQDAEAVHVGFVCEDSRIKVVRTQVASVNVQIKGASCHETETLVVNEKLKKMCSYNVPTTLMLWTSMEPGRILLELTPKISDFGLSRRTSHGGRMIGTLESRCRYLRPWAFPRLFLDAWHS